MNVLNSCYASFMSDSFQLLGRFVGYCFTFLGNLAILSSMSLSWGIFLAGAVKNNHTSSSGKSLWSCLSYNMNMRGGIMKRGGGHLNLLTHHPVMPLTTPTYLLKGTNSAFLVLVLFLGTAAALH